MQSTVNLGVAELQSWRYGKVLLGAKMWYTILKRYCKTNLVAELRSYGARGTKRYIDMLGTGRYYEILQLTQRLYQVNLVSELQGRGALWY